MRRLFPLMAVLIMSFGACDGADAPAVTTEASDGAGIVPAAADVVHASMAASIDGLIAYYPLDGDARDGGPAAVDGVVEGTVPVMDRFGIPGNALSFETLDDLVHVDTPLLSERLGAFTLSVWFQTTATERGTLFAEGVKKGPGLLLRMIPGKDVLQVRCGGAFTMESDGAYNDGQWHHAVATGDGAGAALWIDGQKVVEHTEAYDVSEAMARLPVLGREGEPEAEEPKDGFVGAIDDLAILGRALSDDEIMGLFAEGPPRPPMADAGPNISRFGLQIAVDGSRSQDSDGEIVSYLWDFGDGSEPREGIALSHTYPDFGVYTVRLLVTDDEGAQAYDTLEVSVRNPECVTPNCGQVDTWDPAWSELEMAMLDEVNRYRAAGAVCGDEPYPAVPPLEMNEIARVAARLHSLDMGERNYFEHDNLDGLSPFQRMENAGYQGPDPWGENIQAGSATAVDAMASLMSSPGHCRNIMDPDYKVIGLGYAFGEASDFGHYWTQCFGGGH